MPDKKDIAEILEELRTCVLGLRDEKTALENQVKALENTIVEVKDTKSKEIQTLQEANVIVKKDLQDSNERLSQQLKETQEKLDRFHPELQSLQDELQNAEMKNNLLDVELAKKDEAIQRLESRLSEYTSLIPPRIAVEESISSN